MTSGWSRRLSPFYLKAIEPEASEERGEDLHYLEFIANPFLWRDVAMFVAYPPKNYYPYSIIITRLLF